MSGLLASYLPTLEGIPISMKQHLAIVRELEEERVTLSDQLKQAEDAYVAEMEQRLEVCVCVCVRERERGREREREREREKVRVRAESL